MKRHIRIACLSAAVAAITFGGSQKSFAQTLVWDSSGAAGSGTPVDGTGVWDLSTPNWTNGTTNVVWPNSSASPTTPVASAQFGSATNAGTGQITAVPYDISLGAPIEVQDINLGTAPTATSDTSYSIDDADMGTLTVDGNITKSTSDGQLEFLFFGSALTLSTGNHTFAINDTPSSVPELTMNCPITGAGSVTLDNSQFASGSYGVLIFGQDNSYTGGTTVTDGFLGIATGNGLGSGPVTIASAGTLAIGGPGLNNIGSQTINNTITITRNTYTGGDTVSGSDYGNNPDAFVSANTGNAAAVMTINSLIIDSTDARIAADTSTILLPNPLVAGSDVAPGTAVADFDGDYAGSVILSGDNTAYGEAGNAIEIIGGVEVTAANDAALGGAGSKLILNSGTIHITSALLASNPAFATNFGGHTIVNGTVGTGVDVDQGLTFTVNGLTGGGVGMRGGGTLDFMGTNTFTGVQYYDGVDDAPGEGTETDTTATGIVNFEAGSTTTQPGLRIRSATVNVMGTLNVGGTYTSIGADSTGSNGTPDYGIVNISGSGSVIEGSGDDFNISDNANTHGTINISDNGALTTGGVTYLGKSNGAVGTINQSGGTLTINRNGNFGFDIADGRGGTSPTGVYNLSGGTFTDAHGEVYVGEGVGSATTWGGTWNQTGGTATLGTWFVVGREGGVGTVNISGGTFTRSDGGALGDDPGNQTSIGDSSNTAGIVDQFNVSGTAQVHINTGEMWIGNFGGNAIVNIGTAAGAATGADATASLTVNNWFAVGRGGSGSGVVNVYDGTLTQATANWFDISGDGGSATGTVNVYGGTLNALQMYLGENGSGHATLNIDGGSVNITKNSIFANGNSVAGTLNLNGGTLTAFGFQAHNGGGTGAATFVFNGGVLQALTNNTTAFVGAAVTSVVSTGGAIINTNGYNVAVGSALTHDSTLSGADGGLTKQGAGTLTLSGAETYTGPTTVSAGTLQYSGNAAQTLTSLSIANGAALDLSGGGTITVTSGVSNPLADIQAAYDNGAWDGTSTTSPIITSAYAEAHPSIGLGIGYAISGGSTTLRLTYDGDTDLNGVPTLAEVNAMTDMSSGATWSNGDFNYDGKVNSDDFALAQLGIAESNGNSITALVPEPTMALLALPMLAGFMQRRSRRR